MDKRVNTGIHGLDKMLAGGFRPGSANLVWGAPGAGKTTLGLEFLYRGALAGNAGLWISFEEFPQSLYRDAKSIGWDLEPLERENLLHLTFTSPKVLLQSLAAKPSLFDQFPAERIVLDSISHLRRLTEDPLELRQIYHLVTTRLRQSGATSLLIGESTQSTFSPNAAGIPTGRSWPAGDGSGACSMQIAFMADSIISLNYVEIESAIHRALMVLKMRGSDHAKEIHRFEIRQGGIVVREPFAGMAGILSGISRRV